MQPLSTTETPSRDRCPTLCYKQFLPGLEKPEKSADSENQNSYADFKYENLKIEFLWIFEKKVIFLTFPHEKITFQ